MIKKLASGEMHGQVLSKRQVKGSLLTETIYSADTRLDKHIHENSYFCAVLGGSYTEYYEKRSLECQVHTLLFRPANEIHYDVFHRRGGRCFIIELMPATLDSVRQTSIDLSRPFDSRSLDISGITARLNREFHAADVFSALAIDGLVLELIAHAARRGLRESTCAPSWLNRVRDLLHDTFTAELTLDQIAQSCGVHPVHLATAFRRNFGCTVGEYRRALRIKYACRRIVDADMISMTEIALDAGFSDQSHFIRVFKKHIGVTPGEYRITFR